jgi:carbonic anhydrase
VTGTDDLLALTSQYDFPGPLPMFPARGIALVACMDARLDPARVFGFTAGDVHVIRNAGGVVTDDTIRSLAVSQRLLCTTEVMLVHHTNCGMQTVDDAEFRSELERATGRRPTWSAESSGDVERDVREAVAQIASSPFLPHTDAVRGFVYDVETGKVTEVLPA